MLLNFEYTEKNICEQIDDRLECFGPTICQYATQSKYGRHNRTQEAKIMVNLMQISFLERINKVDDILNNEDGNEIDNSLILTQGDSFGILITTD